MRHRWLYASALLCAAATSAAARETTTLGGYSEVHFILDYRLADRLTLRSGLVLSPLGIAAHALSTGALVLGQAPRGVQAIFTPE
jgi:hypothetical protein